MQTNNVMWDHDANWGGLNSDTGCDPPPPLSRPKRFEFVKPAGKDYVLLSWRAISLIGFSHRFLSITGFIYVFFIVLFIMIP